MKLSNITILISLIGIGDYALSTGDAVLNSVAVSCRLKFTAVASVY